MAQIYEYQDIDAHVILLFVHPAEYYYRSIFEEYFPSESAAQSVPSVPSVACSTAEALRWDAAFAKLNDPSGRAVAGVHEEAY